MPILASFAAVRRPTINISDASSPHTLRLKFSGEITVTASGFFMSEPSFANTLVNDTPIDTVTPTSRFMRSRNSSAIFSPLPSNLRLSVTSSQHSSMPNGSTLCVY